MAVKSWWRTCALVALAVLIGTWLAPPVQADSAPDDPKTPATVAADGLPTVQVDNGTVNKRSGAVVWAQAVVGSTVYVGGDFTTARPAGAAKGVSTVTRTYLLAYDITTGKLIDSFDHTLDGQVRDMAVSPDGKKLYIVGDFAHVDGQWRVRAAAFNTADGSLVAGFKPSLGTTGMAVAATNTTVYVGGEFVKVAPTTGATLVDRKYLAAFSATDGTLLPFRADANRTVESIAVTTDGKRVFVGGRFSNLGGKAVTGLASLDPTTGAIQPIAATAKVKSGSATAAFDTLVATDDGVYGGGYSYTDRTALEGTFRIDPVTGDLLWTADCHGDTYSVAPVGDVVYVANHAHWCGSIGGFPETSPTTYHRAIAQSKTATGTNTAGINGYASHKGEPAPTLLNWFPDVPIGKYTGMNQGGWSVVGASGYVSYAGEFESVNGVPQQGIVRFATADKAPNKIGPQLSGTKWATPTGTSPRAGAARVTIKPNWDPDNTTLTYRLYRGSEDAGPVDEVKADSTFWQLSGTVVLHDGSAPPGTTQKYEVVAVDPFGNEARSAWGSVAIDGTQKAGAYASAVIADRPSLYWRLNDTASTSIRDWIEGDATSGSGVTWKTAGALVGDTSTAATFAGSGYVSPKTAAAPQSTFSIELWMKTSDKNRQVFGFGNARSGASSTYDRSLALDANGRLAFMVAPGGTQKTVTSSAVYTDNAWHHVVATLGTTGQLLYVDGVLVASDTSVTSARTGVTGYWRAGGVKTTYYKGALDEVAVYPTVLAPSQVAYHYGLGKGTANAAPTASFTTAASGADVAFDASASSDPDGTVAAYAWAFGDGTTGTGVKPTHTYAASGAYQVTLTVTDDGGATGTTTQQVTVTKPSGPGDPVASDTFSRTVVQGWGTATLGGTWVPDTKASYFTTDGSRALITIPVAGWTSRARLDGVSRADVDVSVSVGVSQRPTVAMTRAWVSARTSSDFASGYLLRANVTETGQVESLQLIKRVAGAETVVSAVGVSGVTLGTAEQAQLRLRVVGTTVQGKVWKAGTPEPAAWQIQVTDTSVTAAGSVGVGAYTGASAAPLPVVVTFDSFTATVG